MKGNDYIKKIDRLNILLLLISLALAIYLPFKLFIFSYAFIGPLHYLTELNWLKDKKYFITKSKYIFKPFVFFSILISLIALINIIQPSFTPILNGLVKKSSTLLFAWLLIVICIVFSVHKKQFLLTVFACIVALVLAILSFNNIIFFVGLLLPTIVHVYVFTLVFIVLGALKSKSHSGFVLGFLLLFAPIIIYYLPIERFNWQTVEADLKIITDSNFSIFSTLLAKYFKFENVSLVSAIGIKVQIFLAFTYTYHYLNWFTKTNVIGWSKSMTKKESIAILLLWTISVVIYSFDFMYGFYALFFLSYLHVVMEFPLDIISIRALIKSLLLEKTKT